MPSDSTNPVTLGERLRRERERQQLSLRQLAKLVGVSPPALLRWERDEIMPQGKHVVVLARVLELPTTELLTLSGVEYPHDAASLPAMLRAEYDLPPEAIAEAERAVARIARKYGATKKPANEINQRHERRET